jgi:hypothetical protein
MRTLLTISVIGALIFSSCSEDDTTAIDIDVDSEAAMESAMEDIDNLVEAAMGVVSSNGRTEMTDPVLDCASITRDTLNQIITIDYGDGCVGPNGRTREGQILIEYQGRRFEPGSVRITTFNDFFIDSVQVEGTRTVTNLSGSIEESPSFEIRFENGRLSFPDGTVATRSGVHTRTWFRGSNPLQDYVTLEGEAIGIGREGRSYMNIITQPITYQRICGVRRSFIPVSGVKVITVDDEEAIVDYGDGSCDNIVSITRNGETVEREINIRRRFRN